MTNAVTHVKEYMYARIRERGDTYTQYSRNGTSRRADKIKRKSNREDQRESARAANRVYLMIRNYVEIGF